jgi:hypothetical protein
MKHQTIVTTLLATLIIISFNLTGCSEPQPEPKIVYVPQKCVIPLVDEPVIDNTSYTRSKDIIAKAILNYESMKKYVEKLLSSQEVCK